MVSLRYKIRKWRLQEVMFSIFIVNGCYPWRKAFHVRCTSRQSKYLHKRSYNVYPYSVAWVHVLDGFYGELARLRRVSTQSMYIMRTRGTIVTRGRIQGKQPCIRRTCIDKFRRTPLDNFSMKFAERIFNGIPIVTGLFNIRKNFSISKTDIFLTGIKTIFFFFFFSF